MHTLEKHRGSVQDLTCPINMSCETESAVAGCIPAKPNFTNTYATEFCSKHNGTSVNHRYFIHPQDNINSVSSIQYSWTGKIRIKDRDEVFPAHGTADEPTRLKLDHLCLSDAKDKYAWICTPTPPCEWVACTGSILPSFCICWATGNVCLFFCEYFPRWSLPVICCDCEVVWQDVRTLSSFPIDEIINTRKEAENKRFSTEAKMCWWFQQ